VGAVSGELGVVESERVSIRPFTFCYGGRGVEIPTLSQKRKKDGAP
jgi:hypothetical protein